MAVITLGVVAVSVFLLLQAGFSIYLMLFAWDDPERLALGRGPTAFLPPRLSFTVLLPARNEAAVIYETIGRVTRANYPAHLMEVIVVCHASDRDTITEAKRAVYELNVPWVRVETFSDPPISKPHGLNVGFRRSSNQVLAIVDAEDDIDPDIFNVVNTTMLEEEVGIVQAGVQLMNFCDHWFGIHNVLEYFFWFKSRLHFHANVGMVPLGGNTVFIRSDLIAQVGGWDESCLTEDADIGIRLSALGEPIRVIYDADRATREETPDSVVALVRQRTRWNQGFIQVLRKGCWRGYSTWRQRALAVYTLTQPLLQPVLMLLWPFALIEALWLKLPLPAAITSFLPLYGLIFYFMMSVVGSFLFTREYRQRFPLLLPVVMAITFLPYQWLLAISAARALYRELRSEVNWEKTDHTGAHRRAGIVLETESHPWVVQPNTSVGRVVGRSSAEPEIYLRERAR